MNAVLVDTVGFLAVWNDRVAWHSRAVEALTALRAEGELLYTTSFILLECGNASSRTRFRRDVVEVREQFIADGKLIVPTDADIDTAWVDYASGTAGDASVVDHVSFAVMRRLGITDAFTNDHHFKTAGFVTLF
ncbi:MAG TPA: hypothetical protein VHY37_13490 [Tepidisphaeraceae bacterium]|jgi:hypothetical protein|nr:hypothetical protein [Tepidisphaeraceae bacterium]